MAAGRGKRMNSKVPKQYLMLEGKPVLYYALYTLQNSFIDEIILVTAPGEEKYCTKEIKDKYNFDKITKIVAGGQERYHSVYNGLCALQDVDYVFIHDGARPFLSTDILNRSLETVKSVNACVTAVPVTDTIKLVDDNGYVADTPDRAHLWSMQTPQTFKYSLIKEAYDILIDKEAFYTEKGVRITDDAMVAESVLHMPVKIIEGSYDNIKITTPTDLAKAEIICKQRKNG